MAEIEGMELGKNYVYTELENFGSVVSNLPSIPSIDHADMESPYVFTHPVETLFKQAQADLTSYTSLHVPLKRRLIENITKAKRYISELKATMVDPTADIVYKYSSDAGLNYAEVLKCEERKNKLFECERRLKLYMKEYENELKDLPPN